MHKALKVYKVRVRVIYKGVDIGDYRGDLILIEGAPNLVFQWQRDERSPFTPEWALELLPGDLMDWPHHGCQYACCQRMDWPDQVPEPPPANARIPDDEL